MKKSLLAVSLALLLATSSALATHDKGAYVEGNIGSNYTSTTIFDENDSSFSGVGINTNLGYQFNRYLAGEIGYTYYGNSSVNGFDITSKLILPLDERFYVFGKLGASVFTDGSESSTLPFLGLGAAYEITPALDVNVQAQGGTMLIADIGLLSAGLTYHF